MVVGARSAVFAAVPDLGLIVVDEEHDALVQAEADPRYDARRVAAKRARLEGAVYGLGTATPRPEVWHGVPAGEPAGPRRRAPAPVDIVDLRRDGVYPLSRPLRDALGEIADGGGRAILLLRTGAARRRGAPLPHLRRDVPLRALRRRARPCTAGGACAATTAARRERDAEARARAAARSTSRRSAPARARVEAELQRRFPRLDVLRLDADVAAQAAGASRRRCDGSRARRRRGAGRDAAGRQGPRLPRRAAGRGDRRRPGAALVPTSAPRSGPSPCSPSSRAGRGRPGDPRGRVIVQAWDPELRPVALAARHAVAEFLDGELERRRALGYPPFRRLVRVLAAAPSGDVADGVAAAVRAAGGAGPGGRHPARARAALSPSRPVAEPRPDQDPAAPPRGRPPARSRARSRRRPAPGVGHGRRRRGSAVALVSR